MVSLKFTTTYQGKLVNVEISQPAGAGGGFHINIDNLYYGVVTKRLDEWAVVPQHDHYFTEEQKDSILIRLFQAGLIDKCRLKVLNIEDYFKK
ncbi:hypothetical protein SAMN04488524_0550 [Pedobacter africanus]|uniref:Immunity protein 74 n=1 Tax=Pedobacter africanus TaxID=151894 RepID=A0A1W1ZAU1_9SPHI|nr:hypothetical protein SAMN04488524_0550 [Pedobacter africanus]